MSDEAPGDSENRPKYRLVIRAEIIPEAADPQPAQRHARVRWIAISLGLLITIVLILVGSRILTNDGPTDSVAKQETQPVAVPPLPAAPVQDEATSNPEHEPPAAASPPQSTVAAVAATATAPPSTASRPAEISAAPNVPVDKVIPDVPQSALQTIRGTVRVSIEATVDTDGTVTAVTPVDAGPSRYFERLSVEAAGKWKFPPATTSEPRTVLLRFAYRRDGASANSGG